MDVLLREGFILIEPNNMNEAFNLGVLTEHMDGENIDYGITRGDNIPSITIPVHKVKLEE